MVQANSVIATNQNHGNIQKDFDALAPTLAELSEVDIEMKLSMLIRAYDSCISCSTYSIRPEGAEQTKGQVFAGLSSEVTADG